MDFPETGEIPYLTRQISLMAPWLKGAWLFGPLKPNRANVEQGREAVSESISKRPFNTGSRSFS